MRRFIRIKTDRHTWQWQSQAIHTWQWQSQAMHTWTPVRLTCSGLLWADGTWGEL